MKFSDKKWGRYKKWNNTSYIYFSKIETLPLPQINKPFIPRLIK